MLETSSKPSTWIVFVLHIAVSPWCHQEPANKDPLQLSTRPLCLHEKVVTLDKFYTVFSARKGRRVRPTLPCNLSIVLQIVCVGIVGLYDVVHVVFSLLLELCT